MENIKNNKKYIFDKYFPYIVTFIFAAISIILILRHELWRDEIMSWHLGSESSSYKDFIFNMREDVGHPYLWFAILYLISNYITQNPESMKILHLAISITTTFLILKYAPFKKITRVMLVFSYFLFFEYSIISRNYALSILLIVAFCILYKNRQKNLIPIGIVIFLFAQVNIFSFIISIVLFAYLFLEIIRDRKDFKGWVKKISVFGMVIIFILEILVIYWQLGSQFIGYSDSSILSILRNPHKGYYDGLYSIFRGTIGAFIQIPNMDQNFFNTNFLVDTVFNRSYLLTSIFFGILILLPIFIIKKSKIFLYSLSSIGIYLIPLYIYPGSFRHFGYIFIVFMVCLWMSELDHNDNYLIQSQKISIKKIQIIFLIIILSFSLIGSGVAFYFDYKYPFSEGKNVATYIENNVIDDNYIIVGHMDYAAETVAGYLNEDIYYPVSKDTKKLVNWNKRGNFDESNLFVEAYQFILDYEKVIVLKSGYELEDNLIPDMFEKVDNSFDNSIVPSEKFYLYYLDRGKIFTDFTEKAQYDYTNFMEKWTPLADCTFQIYDNKVFIDVNGNDPYFESNFRLDFNEKDYMALIIEIEVPEETDIRFFRGIAGEPYIWEDSFASRLDKGLNNIIFLLKYSEGFERIRIDPVDGNIDCFIHEMTLIR